MTLRKKILLSLTILPFILFLLVLIRPISEGDQHNGIELLFLILGLPILLLNYLEWSDPQLMDEFFGKSKLSQSFGTLVTPRANTLGKLLPEGQPTWKMLALLGIVLVIGIMMGAGMLFAVNRATPSGTSTEITANPNQPSGPGAGGLTPAEGSPAPATPQGSATSTLENPGQIESTTTPTAGASPTVTPTPETSVTPLVTADANRCDSASQKQLATILAGIRLIQPDNDIANGYVVKSIAADELWFMAARIKGPDFDGGTSTDVAVWSFYEKNGTPYNIYSINPFAFQYSDFNDGASAAPPLNMQVDGANNAYECALNGN